MIKDKLIRNENAKPNLREIEKLKSDFPQFFDKDGSFLMDQFKEMLATDKVEINKEGHELRFLGKSYAKYQTSTDTKTVITPDVKHNSEVNHKDSDNIYIIGDNLDAIKHLLQSYSGEIRCIYIDPPYNTGSDGFVYPDNFEFTKESLANTIGIEEDEAERILNMRGKSTHSAWLMFMYPRLMLARDLLNYNGVIFISVDDNEQANLKLLCDGIFGEENFISQLIVASNSAKNNSKYVSTSHEYVLVYSKNVELLGDDWKVKKNNVDEFVKRANQLVSRSLSSEEIHSELLELVKYPRFYDFDHYTYADKKGVFRTDNAGGVTNGNYSTEIIHPKTQKTCAKPSGGWRYKESEIKKMLREDMFYFGEDESVIPQPKRYLQDYLTQVPKSTLFFDSQSSTKWLNNQNIPFAFAKPVELIEYLISMLPSCNVVLDFFSGSATTAHAVMQLNAKDGGNRKFIMVQIPDKIDKKNEAYKIGYKTIDEIGRARIKEAAAKIEKDTSAKIDYGFKLYRLNEPNQNILDKIVDFDPVSTLVVDDMTKIFEFDSIPGKETILTTWLNQDGYGLTCIAKTMKLANYTAEIYQDSLYIINAGLQSKDVMELIKVIENNTIKISRVVIYPYSVVFNVLHEMKKNLSNLRNSKSVTVIERY